MRELLLLDFNGTRYGVWKEDVLAIKELKNIHRLPLAPACFAGVSVLDGSKRKGELGPFVSEFFVSGTAQAEELPSVTDVRVFRTGGETFAVFASVISEVSIRPEPISRLTLTLPFG